ncbi:Lipoprotein-anchoring transpeptidase ErfK/SrfK [Methylobacterium phyllostachyos]|uniref:Lipoprotein-anchoring transpeptidase ErfK/SrfK n=1 Tax=Methylobacterium phyllostachyos TaxID=582672 RepID=A0A1G9RLW8_9HYPH|nr:L,D-transpeptidase [Methylobacterium phyllostachyos]SDM23405.1 Lipoprotein-anchoring transpeptidase ErfK/SrfK [Methylobacterium phyllostachyos]
MRGSIRLCLWAATAVSLWCAPAQAQQARYAEGGYGGGLIEYLVTGGGRSGRDWPQRYATSQRAVSPRPAAAPQRVEPYSGELLPAEPEPVQAYAAPVAYGAAQAYATPQPQAERIARAVAPEYQRQEVAFAGPQRPGTIVIDTSGKHLYLVQTGQRALRYGIGVGRPGFAWSGLKSVSRKAEWPDWTPPAEMLARRPDLPRHMAGGPANPLGARALYLGSSLYRIHGTNEPNTIGQSVSSGCIRMMNEDVIDLYERVPVGTRVEVL